MVAHHDTAKPAVETRDAIEVLMKRIETPNRALPHGRRTLRSLLVSASLLLLTQLGVTSCGGDGAAGKAECEGSSGTLGCACRDTTPACEGDLECLSGVCVGSGDRVTSRDGGGGGASDGGGNDDGSGAGGANSAGTNHEGGNGGSDDCEPGVFDQSRFDQACFQ